MSTEDNKKVIYQFLEAVKSADVSRVSALMTDDATWWVGPSTIFSGVHEKDAFLTLLQGLSDQVDGPIQMDFGDVTAEDNRVSVTASGRIPLKGGQTYANEYHFLFHVDGGKISHGREYADSLHVGEVFGFPADIAGRLAAL